MVLEKREHASYIYKPTCININADREHDRPKVKMKKAHVKMASV